MTKQVQQAITPTHVLGSTGTADTSDLGYRTLGSFKGDLGLGTSLTQTANNGNGTVTNPAFTFAGDPNTGIIRSAADELGFVTNGSEKVRIDDTGNVGIGTSLPRTKMHTPNDIMSGGILSSGDATATPSCQISGGAIHFGKSVANFLSRAVRIRAVENVGYMGLSVDSMLNAYTTANLPSSGTYDQNFLTIQGLTGNVGIGTASPATLLHVNGTIRYTDRPAAGTITAIGFDTNGDLKASSSSLRYKHDIQDYSKGLAEVMRLRPVSFKFNGEDITNIGFIAEEVDALGMTEVMLYDEEQRPNAIIYANMVSLLTKAIQEQQSIINDLKARIETLESNP